MSDSGNGEVGWFFLPLGIGLAIGLFAKPGWGATVLETAVAFSLAEILLGSPRSQRYRAQLSGKAIAWYLALATFWATLQIGLGAVVGVFIQGFLTAT